MAYETFIGLRYLKAKGKETFISVITFISVLGVAIGVLALILVLGVMTGFEEDLKNKILGTTAHIRILKSGGWIKDYKNAENMIKGLDGIVASTPFIYSEAMISTESRVSGVILTGISPDSIGEVTNLEKSLKTGTFSDLNPERGKSGLPGIIIGKELAKSLGTGFNKKVSILYPQGFSTVIHPKRFKVVGIFDSGMYEYDSKWVFISIGAAQRFFNIPDVVTGIEVKIKDIYKAREVSHKIQKKLGFPYHVLDWMELNRNLYSALKLEKVAMFIILVLIILVAAFNIASTLIMVVMEKNKDIAILKAIGAKKNAIMKIFVIEGLTIGIVGTFLGAIAGYILGFLLKKYQFIKLPSDIYYISTLPIKMEFFDFFIIIISSLVICLLSTVYPAWQAAKVDPVEVLRYE
ncbi:MAG: lipoprotein-releasing ABC transporter permease subunit [Thermodesulfobacteriota bacterium]|nr:lipoprotein-releasing ABC transporter permease subunit [Thermodesulfobacteriota bacterium]